MAKVGARGSFDLAEYEHRVTTDPCFVCRFLAGEEGFEHAIAYEDADHVAFLDRYPTLPGRVLVAPKAHREHIVRDISEEEYLRLMSVVRRVARAVERVFEPERTYLLSLGSQHGNAHVHWHVVPLPPGVPFEDRFNVLTFAHQGVVEFTHDALTEIAKKINSALPPD